MTKNEFYKFIENNKSLLSPATYQAVVDNRDVIPQKTMDSIARDIQQAKEALGAIANTATRIAAIYKKGREEIAAIYDKIKRGYSDLFKNEETLEANEEKADLEALLKTI